MADLETKVENLRNLEIIANLLRKDALEMIYRAGSGHPGSSLSEAEIITALYFKVLDIDPDNPDWEDRDRFILSKGHGSPTLYAALVHRGFFNREELNRFRRYGSLTPSYPDFKTPGIDMVSGSLGNGLSAGASMAKMSKLMNKDNRIYVLLGDGELEEGIVWEAALFGAHHKLDNLIAIVDRNGLQINGSTEELMGIEPLSNKWKSFGWDTVEIDGHDLTQLVSELEKPPVLDKPKMIIANTVKGCGVSFMEGVKEWHSETMSESQYFQAINELNRSIGV